MMFFFRNLSLLLVGGLIVFLSIAVVSGGIANAGYIVFLSLVCTLGISLLIWIPLCWFVGWIVFELSSLLLGKERMRRIFRIETSEAEQIDPQVNTQVLSVADYIKKCQRYGWSDTQISSRLKVQGWKDEEIEQAYNLVRNESSSS